MLTSDQKGSIAECKIIAAAAELGIGVFKPLTDGERYDLIFALGRSLLRVQCKWAVRRGDVVVVTARTSRRCGDGFRRTTYSAEEIDLLGAYCYELDRCFLLPPEAFAGRPSLLLRVAPTKNNQRRGVRWADDYDFAATLSRHGAIAQLGER